MVTSNHYWALIHSPLTGVKASFLVGLKLVLTPVRGLWIRPLAASHPPPPTHSLHVQYDCEDMWQLKLNPKYYKPVVSLIENFYFPRIFLENACHRGWQFLLLCFLFPFQAYSAFHYWPLHAWLVYWASLSTPLMISQERAQQSSPTSCTIRLANILFSRILLAIHSHLY